MKANSLLELVVLSAMLITLGCGPAKQAGGTAETGGGDAATSGSNSIAKASPTPIPKSGPFIQVSYSPMADVIHLAEEVSLWKQNASKAVYRAFESRFGLDPTDRELLKKFALVRNELEERSSKSKTPPTFETPFGPEGMFPSSVPALSERFWEAALAAGMPAALSRSLDGIMEPADAQLLAELLAKLSPRLERIQAKDARLAEPVEKLSQLLSGKQVRVSLRRLGRMAGVPTRKLTFEVHPVWVPADGAFEAFAYGDRILVTLPEGKPVGAQQAALVVHEIGRRIFSRMPAEAKALCTMQFIERAGFGGEPFVLVEGVLDAFSHGIVAPMMVAPPDQVPPWPGDDARKKLSMALTPLMKAALEKRQPFDGELVGVFAGEQERQNPPRPGDFVQSAMVIAEDESLSPFKSQVVRWTVWKFPPSKKYNYANKFEQAPGRSVLLVMTAQEIKSMSERFSGIAGLPEVFKKAQSSLGKNAGVIIAAPRESRGYFFLVAAHSPEAMKLVAKKFFSLGRIPQEIVEVK